MSARSVTRGGQRVRLPDVDVDEVIRARGLLVDAASAAYGLTRRQAAAVVLSWLEPMGDGRERRHRTFLNVEKMQRRARWLHAHMDDFLASQHAGPEPINWRAVSWRAAA